MSAHLERVSRSPAISHSEGVKIEKRERFSHITQSSLGKKNDTSSNCFLRAIHCIYDFIKRVFYYLCCCCLYRKDEDESEKPGKDEGKQSSADLSGQNSREKPTIPLTPKSTPQSQNKPKPPRIMTLGGISTNPPEDSIPRPGNSQRVNGPRIRTLDDIKRPAANPPAPPKPLATAPVGRFPADVVALVNSMKPPSASLFSYPPHLVTVCENVCTYQKSRTGTPWTQVHIDYLLSTGITLKDRDKEGKTVLHYAASPEVARYLLEKEPSLIAIADNEGRLPLHTIEDAKTCALLLQYEKDINVRDKAQKTPLHHAATKDKIEFLLQNRADINAQDNEGKTFLSYTLIKIVNVSNPKQKDFYLQLAERLINAKADIHIPMQKGTKMTFLHYAIANDLIGIVDLLIRQKANLNIADERGITPLEAAFNKMASSGFDEFAIRLIKAKADIHHPFTSGNLPIHIAAKYEYLNIIGALRDAGADLNVLNHEKKSPLWLAIESRQTKAASVLIALKADITVTMGKQNLLHLAVSKDTKILIPVLVKSISINAPNDAGQSPLAIAFANANLVCAKQLVDLKADINIRIGNKQQTPLHIAAQAGDQELLKSLIEKQPDLDAYDADLMTPLALALDKCQPISVTLLVNAGCNKDKRFGKDLINIPLDFAILRCASAEQFPIIAQFLIQKGANLDFQDKGRSPFLSAFRLTLNQAYIPVFKSLLEHGAKIELPPNPNAGHAITLELLMHETENVEIVERLQKARDQIKVADWPVQSFSREDLLHRVIETNKAWALGIFRDINAPDSYGRGALAYAFACAASSSYKKMEQTINWLIGNANARVEVVMQKDSKQTLLHFAIENELLDAVPHLLRMGASLRDEDDLGRTALAIAFEKAAFLESFEKPSLVERPINRQNSKRYFDLIKQLMPGSKLDSPMRKGSKQTLLHFAIESCGGRTRYEPDPRDPLIQRHLFEQSPFLEVVKFLSRSVRFNIPDNLGRIPLGIFIEKAGIPGSPFRHNRELFQVVIKETARVNPENLSVPTRQNSPNTLVIHTAVANRLVWVVDALIQAGLRGPSLDVGTDEGYTPFSLAFANRDSAMVQALIRGGAGANVAITVEGRQSTPLHAAVKYQMVDAVRLLLQRRTVHLDSTDQNNKTAIQLATETLEFARGELALLRTQQNADVHKIAKLDGEILVHTEIVNLLNGAAAQQL